MVLYRALSLDQRKGIFLVVYVQGKHLPSNVISLRKAVRKCVDQRLALSGKLSRLPRYILKVSTLHSAVFWSYNKS